MPRSTGSSTDDGDAALQYSIFAVGPEWDEIAQAIDREVSRQISDVPYDDMEGPLLGSNEEASDAPWSMEPMNALGCREAREGEEVWWSDTFATRLASGDSTAEPKCTGCVSECQAEPESEFLSVSSSAQSESVSGDEGDDEREAELRGAPLMTKPESQSPAPCSDRQRDSTTSYTEGNHNGDEYIGLACDRCCGVDRACLGCSDSDDATGGVSIARPPTEYGSQELSLHESRYAEDSDASVAMAVAGLGIIDRADARSIDSDNFDAVARLFSTESLSERLLQPHDDKENDADGESNADDEEEEVAVSAATTLLPAYMFDGQMGAHHGDRQRGRAKSLWAIELGRRRRNPYSDDQSSSTDESGQEKKHEKRRRTGPWVSVRSIRSVGRRRSRAGVRPRRGGIKAGRRT
ncbi:hypothetical protein O9K51_00186 [Purpureocillium lavendulum]|uniref:Uncharacterized protein n=1 Tax=Purpureocillium lavendulum TaxID=1247861 RepID=A0AB34G5C9_9HYPO|nr:hypothetical protein O9K51_00186 [Purpureocillium lavendulum]